MKKIILIGLFIYSALLYPQKYKRGRDSYRLSLDKSRITLFKQRNSVDAISISNTRDLEFSIGGVDGDEYLLSINSKGKALGGLYRMKAKDFDKVASRSNLIIAADKMKKGFSLLKNETLAKQLICHNSPYFSDDKKLESWFHKKMNNAYTIVSQIKKPSPIVLKNCNTYNDIICNKAKKNGIKLNLNQFLVAKSIIQQESQYGKDVYRWEDKGLRHLFKYSKIKLKEYKDYVQAEYQKENPGKVYKFQSDMLVKSFKSFIPITEGSDKGLYNVRDIVRIVDPKTNTYHKFPNGRNYKVVSFSKRDLRNSKERNSIQSNGRGELTSGRVSNVAGDIFIKKYESSYGPMQILYMTAFDQLDYKGAPEDLMTPCLGIEYGVRNLKKMYDKARKKIRDYPESYQKFGVDAIAAAAYNAGSPSIKGGRLWSNPHAHNKRYHDLVMEYVADFKKTCNYKFRNNNDICSSFNPTKVKNACN